MTAIQDTQRGLVTSADQQSTIEEALVFFCLPWLHQSAILFPIPWVFCVGASLAFTPFTQIF